MAFVDLNRDISAFSAGNVKDIRAMVKPGEPGKTILHAKIGLSKANVSVK